MSGDYMQENNPDFLEKLEKLKDKFVDTKHREISTVIGMNDAEAKNIIRHLANNEHITQTTYHRFHDHVLGCRSCQADMKQLFK